MSRRTAHAPALLAWLAFAGCGQPAEEVALSPAQEAALASLASRVEFPVGVAVPAGDRPNSLLASRERAAIVQRHFDSITAENIMKMAYLQPERGRYAFDEADLLIAWARERDILVHGHALVWHRQAPEWMTGYEGEAGEVAALLEDHVATVATHFRGQLKSWDVVNEAFSDDEPSAYRDTVWYRYLGPDYIERSFRTARAADPEADLYYNDYNLSGADGPHKLDRVLEMADDFLARGVPIDGIGFQMHIDHDWPELAAIREAFEKVVARGLKLRISELDISVNSSKKYSALSSELAELQRKRYGDIARLYREVVPAPQAGGITVWGITDEDSWIPAFKKRRDWPLLYTAGFAAKPALAGLAEGLGMAAAVVVFEHFEYKGEDASFTVPLPKERYQNPVAAGFYPDPSITRRGDDFYMVHSSFAWVPGLPVLHSKNLADWRLTGHVLTRAAQADFAGLGVSRGIFAPTIRYDERDGLFYVITTAVDAGGNFYVTASEPGGPWSDPVWLPEIDGIDPDLFFDADGRVWLTHNGPPAGEPLYEGHRAIWLWELDPEARAVIAGSGRIIVNGGVDLDSKPIWIEAPHLFHKDGWYYLICAEGGTGENHSEVVFRARDLADAFMPYGGNPILTQRDLDPRRTDAIGSAGHADFVQTAAGDWWAVFLATRPYDDVHYNTGRETFLLPVTWRDGWPHVLPRGAPVPQRPLRPAGTTPATLDEPLTGNFTWRDEFDGRQLNPHWSRLRRFDASWYSQGDGTLRLDARPESMSSLEQPAFLGRRQQHQRYRASLRLRVPGPGASAGIVAFQNETHHYFLGVRQQGDAALLFVEQAAGATAALVAELALGGSGADEIVDLAIDGDRGRIAFRARTPGSQWLPVGGEFDGRVLSTAVAGGFVGTMLGPHARVDAPAAPDREPAGQSLPGAASVPSSK
jgi:alpha-N-arabinofuranosidase